MKKHGSQFISKRPKLQQQTVLQVAVFNKKFKELKNRFFSDINDIKEIESNINLFFKDRPKYIVFVSICNGDSRSIVKKGSGPDLNSAWENAGKSIIKFLNQKVHYSPKWIKVDIVTDIVQKDYETLCTELQNSREYFYRDGIAFDENCDIAIIEAELNCRLIYDYKEKNISLDRLNLYLNGIGIQEMNRIPEELYTFTCKGYIYDEEVYRLYSEGYDYGRRIIETLNKPIIYDILEKSSQFLVEQIDSNGKFIYGYYPLTDTRIKGYNILRHTSSLWGLILCYKILGKEEIKQKIDSGIKYLLDNIKYYDQETSFVVDESFKEIKLGGNAVTVILLTEYMDTFHCSDFNKIIHDLGNGILKLQNNDTGEFYHVLNSSDFSGKSKDRTIYYDGEAAFALMRLYRQLEDDTWLDAANKSFQYFIHNNYHQYADHWLSYAVNEYLKHQWNEEIFLLGKANVERNLKRIYYRDTTYHTFLELLMAAYEMFQNIISNDSLKSKLSDFDMQELIKVIFHRANHQLNGFIYPEVGMYFKNPLKVIHTFCVKHDAFRVRIDDVQHFIDGYYYFYRYFDSLNESFTNENE